jgi:hypothetical protein
MASCVFAQNVVFTAQASSGKMGLKDVVQVVYTIRDAQNLQTMTPPSTADFDILQGPFTSRSVSSSFNGRTSTTSESLTRTYVMRPTHEGTLTIPPIIAKDAAGHTYQSNAVVIQVVAGSLQPQRRAPTQQDPFGDEDALAMMRRMNQQMQQLQQQMMQPQPQQPQPSPQQQSQQQAQADANDEAEIKKNMFIKVEVDKTKVHVGEQITTSYKLYVHDIAMNAQISKLPSLNGFWTQDFEIPRQPKPEIEELNGKKYQVFLLKKSALFPQQTGTLELDPAEAKGVARIIKQERHKMSDMFRGTLMMNDPAFNNSYYNTMAYKDVEWHLESTPVKVTVTALPEKDKPADYGGAVGRFSIGSKIDKQELTTDDIATITLTISGSGNLKLIEPPKLNLPNGLNTFDPQITDTITGRSTTISGSKIINYVISPHSPGDYEIPATAFTYFNPQTGAYVTAHTEPLKLKVKPGKRYTPNVAGTTITLKDIHDIAKTPLASVTLRNKPMLFTGTYWSMFAFPLLAFIGLVVWKRRDEELSKNTVLLKSKRANKVALQRLVTAKKYLQQNEKTPFYEEISKATWLYLSDKLNIPLSALSRETAAEAMSTRNVPEAVQKHLEDVIWECETALYASGGSQKMAYFYDEAIKVISDLEDVFKA